MRLLVLALTALAFAQPALAREHYRHHHSAYGIHSYHRLVRIEPHHRAWRAAAWRRDTRTAGVGFIERDGSPASAARSEGHGQLDAMIARHAQQNGLPEALVHRVVIRESRYNPGVVGAGGAMGLMQIKLATAREMGYAGTAAGLLDPETNLTYAVRYLAGAYRVAGGNADRAVANYARGYRDATMGEGSSSPGRLVASAETFGYASAKPIERIASSGVSLRHYVRRQVVRAH